MKKTIEYDNYDYGVILLLQSYLERLMEEQPNLNSLKNKYHNPFYQINHPFDIPARILIVGNSGSGKSTLVLEILRRMADTFGHIHLICMNKEEPLYRYHRLPIERKAEA